MGISMLVRLGKFDSERLPWIVSRLGAEISVNSLQFPTVRPPQLIVSNPVREIFVRLLLGIITFPEMFPSVR